MSFNKEQERKKTLRDFVGGNKRNLVSGTLRNLKFCWREYGWRNGALNDLTGGVTMAGDVVRRT